MKPTEEQIKEFWEWCGFKPYLDKYYYDEPPRTLNGWIRDGEPPERFLPKLDLNNIFKYAVPKVKAELGDINLFKLLLRWITCVATQGGDALDLFWVIWEVKERDGIHR